MLACAELLLVVFPNFSYLGYLGSSTAMDSSNTIQHSYLRPSFSPGYLVLLILTVPCAGYVGSSPTIDGSNTIKHSYLGPSFSKGYFLDQS